MKKFALAALLFLLSILLYKDFFSEGHTIGLGLVIIVYFTYYLFHYKLESKDIPKEKKYIITQVLITVYFVIVILIFTLLKGKSSVGISFDNSLFWLVLLVAVIELIARWRRVKRATN